MISLFEGGLFEIFVFVVKYCHSKILVPPKYLKICYCCSNNMKKSPGTFSGQISLRLNASDCKIYSSFLEHFFRAICSREKSPPKITSEVIFKRIKIQNLTQNLTQNLIQKSIACLTLTMKKQFHSIFLSWF